MSARRGSGIQLIRVTAAAAYKNRAHMRLTSARLKPSSTGFVVGEKNDGLTRQQRVALQRIAALQRMREDAREGNRAAMLSSIDKLLELETRILREAKDTDPEPA